jgi:hypothetical protein
VTRARVGALAGAGAIAVACAMSMAGWLASDNVLALWTLVSFCG